MGKHKKKIKKHKKDKNKSKKQKKEVKECSSSSEEWVEKVLTDDISSSDDEYSNKKYSRKEKYDSRSSDQDESSSSGDNEGEKIEGTRHHKHKTRNKKQKSRTSSEESDDSVDSKTETFSNRTNRSNESSSDKREDWMNIHSSFLTSSNSNRKLERDIVRKLEREKQQYNPRECSRELNPYWKDGGDGLPKFKKPNLDEFDDNFHKNKKYSGTSSNWRKKENKADSSDAKETSANAVEANDGLTEAELNALAAKLLKAEIMGNTKLVTELKDKLEKARNTRNIKGAQVEEKQILLTRTDSHGKTRPLESPSEWGEPSGSQKRKKNIETHNEGKRVRYFADDDKYSLKQMFEKEKYNSAENQNSEFLKMISKVRKNDDLDDIFSDNIRKKEPDSKVNSRNKEKAISEYQKMSKSLDNCNRCIQSERNLKHLMISMKETCYLTLPYFEPLTEGHCLIIPIRHVPCSTQLDENEWAEIRNVRKAIVNLFKSKNEEAIFFETAISLYKFPHMCIECVPMPKEDGDLAPIYFKKAIDESETEWAHNKKLVSLKGKDVRKAIPKGLPYFSVSFGMEEGFAHVIEDEKLFPNNFAQEIIGGMLDVHHSKWRKPKRQSFEEQSKRVIEFSRDWTKFDPTEDQT